MVLRYIKFAVFKFREFFSRKSRNLILAKIRKNKEAKP